MSIAVAAIAAYMWISQWSHNTCNVKRYWNQQNHKIPNLSYWFDRRGISNIGYCILNIPFKSGFFLVDAEPIVARNVCKIWIWSNLNLRSHQEMPKSAGTRSSIFWPPFFIYRAFINMWRVMEESSTQTAVVVRSDDSYACKEGRKDIDWKKLRHNDWMNRTVMWCDIWIHNTHNGHNLKCCVFVAIRSHQNI